MFRSVSRRFRIRNTVGLLLVHESAANSQGGVFSKLKADGSLLESFLPCVTTCRHSHSHHHIHRIQKGPLKVRHQQDFCERTFYPLVTSHRYYVSPASSDDKTPESKESSKSLSETDEKSSQIEADKEEDDKPKGILQRFKDAYKEYGKALVGVHLVTSACWFGSFYFAAANGLDIVPILETIGAGEKVIHTFQLPGVGNTAVAYLCYKIATPLRYTVTIVGTQLTVKCMRRWGYWEPVKPEDSIRSLMREGSENVKDKVKDRVDDVKDKVKDRIDDVRDDVKDKITEMRGDMKDKYSDWKEKKREDLKDWRERKGEDIKERVSDLKESVKDQSTELRKKIEERSRMDRFK